MKDGNFRTKTVAVTAEIITVKKQTDLDVKVKLNSDPNHQLNENAKSSNGKFGDQHLDFIGRVVRGQLD